MRCMSPAHEKPAIAHAMGEATNGAGLQARSCVSMRHVCVLQVIPAPDLAAGWMSIGNVPALARTREQPTDQPPRRKRHSRPSDCLLTIRSQDTSHTALYIVQIPSPARLVQASCLESRDDIKEFRILSRPAVAKRGSTAVAIAPLTTRRLAASGSPA